VDRLGPFLVPILCVLRVDFGTFVVNSFDRGRTSGRFPGLPAQCKGILLATSQYVRIE
jgi:hypothetical protein